MDEEDGDKKGILSDVCRLQSYNILKLLAG